MYPTLYLLDFRKYPADHQNRLPFLHHAHYCHPKINYLENKCSEERNNRDGWTAYLEKNLKNDGNQKFILYG